MSVRKHIDKQGYVTLSMDLANKEVREVQLTDNCFTRGSIGVLFFDKGIYRRYELTRAEVLLLSDQLKEILKD